MAPPSVTHRSPFWSRLIAHARWGGLFAGLALLGAVLRPAPPPATPEGLAELLGQAAGVRVIPGQVRWEQSPGFLWEALWGRRVLFLGAPVKGVRDLFRAWVRLGYEGQPVAVTQVRNLTRTPLGDDVGLQVEKGHAVFATVAYERIQSVTVLDLDGVRAEDRSGSYFSRILGDITNWQMTGSWSGIGRTDIVFQVPASQATLELTQQQLNVDVGVAERALSYFPESRTIRGPERSQAYGVRVVPNRHPPKPFVLWSVDTVREEVGPAPIAWLEQQFFGMKDLLHRTTYNLVSTRGAWVRRTVVPVASAPVPDSNGPVAASWPPASLQSSWAEVEPGEGLWAPVELPFLRPSLARVEASSEKPPAYFYQTFIRPDPHRPYARVHLVAMDMRQLELGMQAGFEDPEPLVGSPGEGHLPDEPGIVNRLVAAFNGAFKTEHGKYGMMVDRRVLLPPVAGGATVVVDNAREVGLGSWPASNGIPPEFSAFRQNLDPLVEDGVPNPTGRRLWGWQLEGKSVLTERTALCVSTAGHIYYAWGEEIDGPTLGQALHQAGCTYALHLDMNPGHCGFVYARVDDLRRAHFKLKYAVPKMSVPLDRYMRWSPKDFFYVLLRDPTPQDHSGANWVVAAGTQPPPAWWPGIYTASLDVGGLVVELLSVEKGRVDWTVRAGSLEPNELGAPLMKTSLVGSDQARMLLAIGMGHTTRASRLGLAFGTAPSIPLNASDATLLLSPGGSPRVEKSGKAPPPSDSEAVQLPWLAQDGAVNAEGRAQGPMRQRAALCVTPTGRTLVARARHDTHAPLVVVLLKAGCRDVVDLDRGSHHPPFVHRTGTDLPPTGDYETTVLYALARPMSPHAYRWKAAGSGPSTRPTGYDIPAPRRASSAN